MDKKISSASLRPASTIILVREKKRDLEIYLLKRSENSKFMGGLYVFPGGVVDEEDRNFKDWEAHIDVDRSYINNQMGKDEYAFNDVLGFCIAGIRETLEESGVFLASGRDKGFTDIKEMAAYRLKQDFRQPWFKKKIMDEGWILSLSLLKKWSHWITPEVIKKRFDTLFFLALMPEGQECAPDMMETEKGIWITPQKALEKNFENKISLSPPTLVTLTQMLNITNLKALDQVLQDRPWPASVTPSAVKSSKGPMVLMPWDPMYENAYEVEIVVDPKKILDPGQTFSRVWNDQGAWRPVGV